MSRSSHILYNNHSAKWFDSPPLDVILGKNSWETSPKLYEFELVHSPHKQPDICWGWHTTKKVTGIWERELTIARSLLPLFPSCIHYVYVLCNTCTTICSKMGCDHFKRVSFIPATSWLQPSKTAPKVTELLRFHCIHSTSIICFCSVSLKLTVPFQLPVCANNTCHVCMSPTLLWLCLAIEPTLLR